MNDFSKDLEHCLRVLESGGVILYPTDTVWGLGCDATNAAAVAKIFSIKQRPEAKSLIVLLADERDLLQYVAAPDPEVFDYLDTVKNRLPLYTMMLLVLPITSWQPMAVQVSVL